MPHERSPIVMLWHSDMIVCDEHKDGTVLNETMLRIPVNEGEVSPVYYLQCFLSWVHSRENSPGITSDLFYAVQDIQEL